MEFLVVFIICLLVLIILMIGLTFGRAPTYRPEREEVLQLMRGIADRSTTEQAWTLFIHTPVTHDEMLEKFRLRCYHFDQGTDQPAGKPGINGYLYDTEGRECIAEITRELDRAIREAPLIVDF